VERVSSPASKDISVTSTRVSGVAVSALPRARASLMIAESRCDSAAATSVLSLVTVRLSLP
jgi:hypothetical protein